MGAAREVPGEERPHRAGLLAERFQELPDARLQGRALARERRLQEVEVDRERLVPALLSDPEGKKKFFAMVDSLKATPDGLASFSKDLSGGAGLLPKLVKDEAFAREFTNDLRKLSSHLASVAAKLDSTEGSAGRLIADPSVADAINDILVVINESKTLRWLVRDRQKASGAATRASLP